MSILQQSAEIFVTFVQGEGPFLKLWAQLDRTQATLIERLILQLSEQFERGFGLPTTLSVGQLCCARYSDGVYYRARVTNANDIARGQIDVHFIDYGNSEVLCVRDIRSLEDLPSNLTKLATVNAQATEFFLAGVVPLTGAWDEDSLAYIRQTICYEELRCMIVGQIDNKKLLRVYYNDEDFSQILIAKNLGVAIAQQSQQQLLLQGKYSVSSVPPQFPGFPMPPPQRMMMNPVQAQPVSVPLVQAVRMMNNEMLSYRPPAAIGLVRETVRVFRSPVLEINSEHMIYVSYVEDGPVSFAIQQQSAEETLSSIMNEINNLPPTPLMQPLMPGSVCLGRFSEDQTLCRAVVIAVLDDKCKLYYVDFGNSEILSYSDIYELPQQFINPQVMALRFTLAGLKTLSLSEELKSYFKEIVTEKLLRLRVVPPEGPPLKQYGELYLNGMSVLELLNRKVEEKQVLNFPDLPLLEIGSRDSVKVSFVINTSHFYVQSQVHVEALNSVMKAVETICTGSAANVEASQLKVGVPCCALYSEDGKWYRAKILSLSPSSVEVMYVDYGNTDSVSVSSLKCIDPKLIQILKPQAMLCCLNGFQNNVDEELAVQFEEITLDKSLFMIVTDVQTDSIIVDLYENVSGSSVNIGFQLLAKNVSAQNTDVSVAQNVASEEQLNSQDLVEEVDEWQETSEVGVSATNTESHEDNRHDKKQNSWGTNKERFNQRESSTADENSNAWRSRKSDRDGGDGTKPWQNRDSSNWRQDDGNRGNRGKWGSRNDGERSGSGRWNSREGDDRQEKPWEENNNAAGYDGDRGGKGKWSSRTGGERVGSGRLNTHGDADRNERSWEDNSNNNSGTGDDGDRGGRGKWNNRTSGERGGSGRWNSRGDDDRSERTWEDGDNETGKDGGEFKKKPWNRDSGYQSKTSRWNADDNGQRKKWNDEDGGQRKKWNDEDGGQRKKWNDEDGGQRKKWNDEDGGQRKKWNNEDGGQRKKWNDEDGGQRKKWNDEDSGQRKKWNDEDGGQRKKWNDEDGGQRKKWNEDGGQRRKWNDDDGKRNRWREENEDSRNRSEGHSNSGKWRSNRNEDDAGAPRGERKPWGNRENSGSSFRSQKTFHHEAQVTNVEVAESEDTWDDDTPAAVTSKLIEESIQIGAIKPVQVVFITNLWEFCVQVTSESEKLTTVMDGIATMYSDGGGNPIPSTNLKSGTACVARYSEDGTVYRAVIESATDESVSVIFCDYGNKENVPLSDVKEIAAEFLNLPIQGIICSLAATKPQQELSWSEEEIDSFTTLTESKELQAHFTNKKNGIYEVILQDTETSLYINEQFGASADEVQASLSKEVVGGVIKTGVDSNQNNELATPDQRFAVQTFSSESVSEVIITWFISPEQFYCQPLSSQSAINDMMDLIQSTYCNKSPLTSSVQVGSPVIAKFLSDKVLYRAEVKDIPDPSSLVVQFVDFGNCDLVSKSNVWDIEARFMTLPKQAVVCTLKGVKPRDTEWQKGPKAVDKYFQVDKFQCTFHYSEQDKYSVSLSSNGKSVAEQLTEEGFAVPEVEQPETIIGEEPVDLSLLPGQTLLAHVTYVEGISKFFVQLNPSAANKIQALIEEYVQNPENGNPIGPSKLSVNSLCIASPDAAQWYRGKIIDCTRTTGVFVKFIDFGDGDEIPLDKVLEISDILAHFPEQAVECCLCGSIDLTIAPEVEDQFKADTEATDVILHIQSFDNERLLANIFNTAGNKLEVIKEITEGLSEVEPLCPLPILSRNMKVWVTHNDGPDCLWLQRVSNADTLAELLDGLYAFYESEGKGVKLEANVGKLCAAKSANDEQWYRGRVSSINSDEDTCTILFIDYGNSETLPSASVMELDNSFLLPHAQAVCTSLPVVFDKGEEVIIQLTEMTVEKEFVCLFSRKEQDKWVVDLLENGLLLSNRLLESGLVTEVMDFTFPADIPLQPTTERLKKGISYPVCISHIDSPSHFWVQRAEDTEMIIKLQSELQVSADVLETVTEAPVVGTECIALFSEGWYRAVVLESSDSAVTVLFIDYGNTDTIDIASGNIKILPDNLKGIQGYAEKCSLFECCELKLSDEATRRMEELVESEEEVTALVLNDAEVKHVDLRLADSRSVIEVLTNENLITEIIPTGNLVYVSNVNSPSEFWIQYESNTKKIEELENAMLEADSFSALDYGIEGALCVAKFSDGLWYRAQILKQTDAGFEVLYIDYGNSSVSTEMRSLPEDLANVPALAKQCSLSMPVNVTDWSSAAVTAFSEKVKDSSTTFEVEILEDGDCAVVSLLDNGQRIEEELATLCEVSEIKSVTDAKLLASISHVTSPSDFWIQFEESMSQLDEITNRLTEAESYPILSVVEENTLCVSQFSEDGLWYRAKILKQTDAGSEMLFVDYGNSSISTELRSLPEDLANIPSVAKHCSLSMPVDVSHWSAAAITAFSEKSNDGLTTFEVEILEDGDCAVVSLLDNGQRIEEELATLCEVSEIKSVTDAKLLASISHVTSPSDFWIQFEESMSQLDEITNRLTEAESYPILSVVEENTLCVSQFSEDGLWYRAKILKQTDAGSKVLFVDYGNSSISTELRSLPEDLANIPSLAKHCSLSMPVDVSHWSAAAITAFSEKSNDGLTTFEVEILEDGDCAVVSLLDNGQRIEEELATLCEVSEIKSVTDAKLLASISHVTSPSDFWIQFEESMSQLDEITNRLTEAESYPILSVVEENTLCASQFSEDGLWYRAKILKQTDAGSEMLFVDYGNSSISTELRSLPEDLANIPSLAKHCSLSMPVDVSHWSAAAITAFSEKSNDGCTTFEIEILKEGDSAVVSLLDNGQRIEEELSSLCAITEIKSVTDAKLLASISHVTSPSDFWIQFEESMSQLDEITNRLAEAGSFPTLSDVEENTLYVSQFADDGQWYRAKVLKETDGEFEVLYVDNGNSSFSTELRILPEDLTLIPPLAKQCSLPMPVNINHWSPTAVSKFTEKVNSTFQVEILEEGSCAVVSLLHNGQRVEEELASFCTVAECKSVTDTKLHASISHAISPSNFWIQFEESLPQLDEITNRLVESENFPTLDNVGEDILCVSQYSVDGNYYRSKVLNCIENRFEVMFVDFGNTAISTELRELPHDLQAIPPLAKNCSLFIPSNITEWPEIINDEFLKVVDDPLNLHEIEIINNGDPAVVCLWDDGVKIEEKLLKVLEETTIEVVGTENKSIINSSENEKEMSENVQISDSVDSSAREGTEVLEETFEDVDEENEDKYNEVKNMMNNDTYKQDVLEKQDLNENSEQLIPRKEIAICEESVEQQEYGDLQYNTNTDLMESADEYVVNGVESVEVTEHADETKDLVCNKNESDLETGVLKQVDVKYVVNESNSNVHNIEDTAVESDMTEPKELKTDNTQTKTDEKVTLLKEYAEPNNQELLVKTEHTETLMTQLSVQMRTPGDSTKISLNSEKKCEKIIPGNIDSSLPEQESFDKVDYAKKMVPFSISRGSSSNSNKDDVTQSAPSTPLVSRSDRVIQRVASLDELKRKTPTSPKLSHNDRIVPGSISRGESWEELTVSSSKLSHGEKIVPGSISRGISDEILETCKSEMINFKEKTTFQEVPACDLGERAEDVPVLPNVEEESIILEVTEKVL